MERRFLYLLAGAHFANDFSSGALMAVLPFLVTVYGYDYASVAGLVFAWSFLSSLIQPLFGYLADRVSQQWFIGGGVLLSGLPLGVCAVTESYGWLFAAVMVMGVGSAIFHPEAARRVNHLAKFHAGSWMSLFSVGGNAGYGLGPLVGAVALAAFGRESTLFFSLFAVLTGGALLFLVPYMSRALERREAGSVVPAEVDVPAETASAEPAAPAEAVAGVNDWGSFRKLMFVILWRSTAFCAITSFLPLFCIQSMGTTNTVGCAVNTVLSVTSIVTTLAGGRLADHFGWLRVMRLCCLLLAPLLAVGLYAGGPAVLFLFLVPLSFAMYGPYSSMVLLGQGYLPHHVGLAAGITLGLSFSIGGIAAPALGRFADTFGIDHLMALAVLLCLLCGLSTLWLKDIGGKEEPHTLREAQSTAG